MTPRREKVVTALVAQTAIAGAFAVAQRVTGDVRVAPPRWLVSPLDGHVALIPAAAWLYVSWYLAPGLILPTELAYFRRVTLAAVLAFFGCAVGWVAVPGAMPRPALACDAGYALAALCAVYRIDPPTNLFPSFHAALAAIVACTPLRSRAARFGLRAWMAGICVSCVLTKQHYVADVVAGMAVGFGAMAVAGYVREPARRVQRHTAAATNTEAPIKSQVHAPLHGP
jgi:membrane-associated phospholipid phosphatase